MPLNVGGMKVGGQHGHVMAFGDRASPPPANGFLRPPDWIARVGDRKNLQASHRFCALSLTCLEEPPDQSSNSMLSQQIYVVAPSEKIARHIILRNPILAASSFRQR